MQSCWNDNPEERPSFTEILTVLNKFAGEQIYLRRNAPRIKLVSYLPVADPGFPEGCVYTKYGHTNLLF